MSAIAARNSNDKDFQSTPRPPRARIQGVVEVGLECSNHLRQLRVILVLYSAYHEYIFILLIIILYVNFITYLISLCKPL